MWPDFVVFSVSVESDFKYWPKSGHFFLKKGNCKPQCSSGSTRHGKLHRPITKQITSLGTVSVFILSNAKSTQGELHTKCKLDWRVRLREHSLTRKVRGGCWSCLGGNSRFAKLSHIHGRNLSRAGLRLRLRLRLRSVLGQSQALLCWIKWAWEPARVYLIQRG